MIDANGCTACASIFIDSTNCNGLNVSAVSTNASCTACIDGTAMASPSGGTPPFAYTWYTSPLQTTQNASGLPPGSYAVCITDANGCTACDSVTISVGSCSAYFNLYADSVPHTYYAVNLASGVAPLSYVWSWGDGTYDSVPFPDHTYSAAGYYDICLSITDSAGCTNTFCSSYFLQKQASAMIYVNVVDPLLTSIDASAKDVSFILFPNPASNTLNITTLQSKDDIQYQIINTLGATITESKTTAKDFSIDVSSLSTGIYFIHLQSGNAKTVKRFVKE